MSLIFHESVHEKDCAFGCVCVCVFVMIHVWVHEKDCACRCVCVCVCDDSCMGSRRGLCVCGCVCVRVVVSQASNPSESIVRQVLSKTYACPWFTVDLRVYVFVRACVCLCVCLCVCGSHLWNVFGSIHRICNSGVQEKVLEAGEIYAQGIPS